MKKKLRCLFYVQDGYGMGHISRVAYLSEHLKLRNPKWDIVVVTGDKNAIQLLPSGVEFIKLPSFKIVSDQNGRMINSSDALSSYSLTSILRRKILDTVLNTFTPGVIVVEHLARGHGRELAGLISDYKKNNQDCNLILGLRGILGTKDYAYNTVLTSMDLEYISNIYDKVFIYTDKKIIDMVSYYDLPLWFENKILYSGYVMAPEDKTQNTMTDLSSLGIEKGEPYVGVGLGSGVSAENVLENILEALSLVDGLPKKKVIISGPKFSLDAHNQLVNKYPDFNIIKSITNYTEFIANATFFIGFAGYNTVSACLKHGNPALFISREQSMLGEQQHHIQALENLGLCSGIKENEASCKKIVAALNVVMKKCVRKHHLAVDGGSFVANYIDSLKNEEL